MTIDLAALGIPTALQTFEATHSAALARLAAIHPAAYARTRNALDGAVTGLSPYFTHGLVSLPDAARSVCARHTLGFDDKLVFEWGWRAFFHHVWSRAGDGGDAILRDMHSGMPWHGQYAASVPNDIREGRTGVPAIDSAVKTLYATGYLHNHARMWLASYVVHLRKVHWRAGADWLYGHLLDGDLPCNHLSWQWVAGTFSNKPYLFNAENVLRYAPAGNRAAWASPGTVIDTSYEELDAIARLKGDVGPEFSQRGQRSGDAGTAEPALHGTPPAACLDLLPRQPLQPPFSQPTSEAIKQPPDLSKSPIYASFMPVAQSIPPYYAIENIANKNLELVHPWALAPRLPSGNTVRLGVIHLPAHANWPWSERRWSFVLQAMAGVTDALWVGDLTQLAVSHAARVTAQATQFPGYRQALAALATPSAAPQLFANPAMACRSFSKFYDQARRQAAQFSDLL